MSWKNVELGNLCDVLDSQRKPITKRDRIAGEYPYYGATGIVDYVGDYIFDEKLVLIGEDGAKWESGERTAFIANGKYWVNNHAHVIRPKRDFLLDEWLVYYFYYKDLKEFVTGLTVPKLNQGQLKIIPIPLPPLATQKNIVAKLDAIFAEIDKATAAAEANAKNAEALFQSYLSQVFEGDIGWKSSIIGEVLAVIKNGINCEQNKIPIGNKITRIETIAKKRFDFERVGFASLTEVEKERGRLLVGDILFSHINSPIHVGKTAIYEAEEEIYHGINLLLMRTTKDVNPYFFNMFLNHLFATGYWERNCKKSVNQASVNQKDICKVDFSYPQLPVQEEIVARLDALLEEVTKSNKSYKNKVIKLINFKKSILNKAFAGDLVKE